MYRFRRGGRFLSRRTAAWVLPVLAAMIVLAAFAAACGSEAGPGDEASPTSDATQSKILRIASNATINTWDPRAACGREPMYMMGNTYETLLIANPPGSAEPFSPCLATSWSVSDDGLTWTFKIREGVKFHDGTPLTAAAVKYSLESTKDYGQGAAFMWLSMKSCTAPDDYTVEITTDEPLPLGMFVSAINASYIFSPASEGKDDAWWNAPNEMGTGPYKLVSYKPNEEIVFERNEDYWGGWKEGQFDKVVVKQVAEAATHRQMLEAGEVDFADMISYDAAPAMESNPNVKIYAVESLKNMFVMFNVERKPLDNVKVRQALSYAIPYDDIVKAATNGYATQARGIIPVGCFPHDDSTPQYTYDPEKAKQLLAEAGYPDGGFSITMTYATDEPGPQDFMPLIKEAFGAVGVKVNLQPLLGEQANEKARGPAKDRQDAMSLSWWPLYAHGYDYYKGMFRTEVPPIYNFSYLADKELDDVWDKAFAIETREPEKALELYKEGQRRIVEEAASLNLYDTKLIYGALPDLKLDDMAINFNYPTVLFWYHATH